jgi:hypothetical protein
VKAVTVTRQVIYSIAMAGSQYLTDTKYKIQHTRFYCKKYYGSLWGVNLISVLAPMADRHNRCRKYIAAVGGREDW